MSPESRIFVDFQKTDDQRRILLTTIGTREDLARQKIELRRGLRLAVYSDDLDESNQRDDLIAEGVVDFDDEHRRWVLAINWDQLRHERDRRD